MEKKLLVLGIGGAGSNTINYVAKSAIERNFDCAVIDTTPSPVEQSGIDKVLTLGLETTKGLSVAGDVSKVKKIAEESKEEIKNLIKGYEFVLVTCGAGGGTGSGVTPVVIQIANELGIPTTVFTTLPFAFEGADRMEKATNTLSELEATGTFVSSFQNNNLSAALKEAGVKFNLSKAFALIDDIVLRCALEATSSGTFTAENVIRALQNNMKLQVA